MTEDLEPVSADEPMFAPAAAAGQNPPLLASSASAAYSGTVTTRPLWLAFLAAAAVALLGGLLWAGISIATGYNLGILALLIGAVTGLTAHRVAGAPVGGFERGLAGIFAAGAVIIGNYVIFVHDLKVAQARTVPVDLRVPVGYLDGHWMSFFVHHFRTIVHGFDWFWIALAAFAAIRTAGGTAVLGMGRARS